MARGASNLAYWDYDKETSTVSCPHEVITDLNYAVIDGQQNAFRIAVGDVTLGVNYKDTSIQSTEQISGTPPSDPDAQREKKWLVQMTDNSTYKAHTMEIPTADLTLLDTQDRGRMDNTSAEYAALKSAIEALYRTEAGNTVTVGDIIFVGRNL